MEVVVTMLWVLDMKFPVAGVKSGVMGCQHNSTTLTGNGFEVKCDTNDTLSLYAIRTLHLVRIIPVSRSSHRYHFMLVITIPFYNSYQTEPRILAHITINKLSRTKRKQ